MRSIAIISLFGMLLLPAFTQTTKPKKPAATNSATTKPTPKKPPTAATKPKPVPDESGQWEKAIAVADSNDRIAAIKNFLTTFPKTKKREQALEMLLVLRADIGNERLLAGDMDSAADFFKVAAAEAPKPVPEKLFSDTLAKFPANLFFRGQGAAAIEIAKLIEDRADANASQLLVIAAFYMSVENGAEARRVAEKAIILEPASSAAYQTLGLANRIDFQLEASAAAYAKALDLEPDSLDARRGLAEMDRSLGRSDEAAALYKEILAKDSTNIPAKTGLILAQFETGKRAEAESALKASLEENSGNVILLANAAYWYAANGDGDKAVDLGRKAIAAEPRFIWSHIALARGLLLQNKPLDAERTLLAARRYGNFPTLEYEIASARFAAGFYREAAEILAEHFSIKDGSVSTDLGGRVPRVAADFTELVGFERRASIFASSAADSPDNAAQLKALLEFSNAVNAADAASEKSAIAADKFVGANDRMKTHRQLFAASILLSKNLSAVKALELAKNAVSGVEAALDAPSANAAVLADEIYQARKVADSRNEYIQVPAVARTTLSSILRGRIEEISGWALLQSNNAAESIVRLKRAVSVLPADSAWWRSSMWRMGTALESSNRNAEALDAYYRSYLNGKPDPIKYAIIESLYKRTNGNTDGLEIKIGRNPLVVRPEEPVSEQTQATPEPTPMPTPETKPEVSPTIPAPTTTATPVIEDKKPLVTATPVPERSKDLFPPVVIQIPPPSDSKPRSENVAETKEITPCVITSSEESIAIQNNGSELAIIIGTEGDEDLTTIIASSSSPSDVDIRREQINAIKGRALFVVRSTSSKTGVFQVSFSLPCGKKDVVVNVR